MNTPTPTPRTDAAWASSFEPCEYRAAHTARTMRECSQQLETELTTLTAERDHWQKIAVSASREREHNANVAQAMTAERDQLRVELELADVMYQRECEVEHELRTEVERLRSDRDCEKRLRKDAEELREDAIERAMKAKADLVALEQCHDDNCRGVVRIADELAKERARLDWLMAGGVCMVQHTGGFHVSRLHAPVSRADIDAAMKEDAK